MTSEFTRIVPYFRRVKFHVIVRDPLIFIFVTWSEGRYRLRTYLQRYSINLDRSHAKNQTAFLIELRRWPSHWIFFHSITTVCACVCVCVCEGFFSLLSSLHTFTSLYRRRCYVGSVRLMISIYPFDKNL